MKNWTCGSQIFFSSQFRSNETTMFIIKRYPLTSSSILLFGSYTVALAIVKRIKRIYRASLLSEQQPYIVPELQQEILDQLMRDLKPEEILPLILVCKDWSQYLNNNRLWITVHRRRLVVAKKKPDSEERNYVRVTEETIQKYGNRLEDIFTAKIAYFIYRKRVSADSGFRATLTFPDEDLQRTKQNDLYVPWLNQSVITNPEIIWKFMWTAVRHPGWIFRWTKRAIYDGRYWLEDKNNAIKIAKMAKIILVPLSILPIIDNILYYTHHVFNTMSWVPNMRGIREILWNAAAVMPMTSRIHSVLIYAFYQLFEQSFTPPVSIAPKITLLSIITVLSTETNKYLTTDLYYFFFFGLFVNLAVNLVKKIKENPYTQHIAIWTIALPWVYIFPIVGSLGCLVAYGSRRDAEARSMNKRTVFSMRYPFILYFLTLTAPLFIKERPSLI